MNAFVSLLGHRQFSTTERYCGATTCAQAAAAEVAEKLSVGCKKSEQPANDVYLTAVDATEGA